MSYPISFRIERQVHNALVAKRCGSLESEHPSRSKRVLGDALAGGIPIPDVLKATSTLVMTYVN